ncbi:GNAT family N-acetyltransferase [Paraliobacillus salinarum]|uniref:GNAT family N-acetyltransferase n=1 Tax=Paraliobacillus salinarum TaxID=1158996 RepID=UPI0015F4DA54|nr:GNAT family N-acetyltransferase [Paraliobacillus salinarum]
MHSNVNILSEVENVNEIELALTKFNSKRALSLVEKNLVAKRIGNCILLIDSKSPGSMYYNRIKGFGINDMDRVDEILHNYYSKQLVPCFDMTAYDLKLEVAPLLMRKGFYCAEQLVFLGIEPYFKKYQSEMRVVQVNEENVYEFLDLVTRSNDMNLNAEILEGKAMYFYEPNFKNYMVYIGEEAIGMGSLFIKGETGYIANDFTFASHRGNGVQQMLLYHRMNVAKQMGFKKLYTDVAFGSISHQNMLKLGFETIYQNSFWIKSE